MVTAWRKNDDVGICEASRVEGIMLLNRNKDKGADLTRTVLCMSNTAGHVKGVSRSGAIDSFSGRRRGQKFSVDADLMPVR